MSLNGLDDASIKEAHDAAAAELGGWFLLKYTSRDEVGLLAKGSGGIVEIRNAIAQYSEPEPLYGFLRYRRRSVIIKYMPEDCSRLIKARSTVHFNAVTERFSPHDTIFPISSPKELRDPELSAACSLHTASGSTSSSTSSLRRRRLMEIAEDEEDENKTKRQSTVLEELTSIKSPSVADGPPPPLSPPPPPSVTEEVGDLPELQARSPTKTIDEPRRSSQSTRPDLYSYSSYGSTGKPKVKLGPRPSLDVGGRPHTSSATAQYRPVSTLPAGLKLFSKASKAVKERPKSQYNVEATSMLISPPPIPESGQSVPARPHTSGGRPSTSSGASMRSPTSISHTPKSPTITPEKARLMKALQLRKKQMKTPPAGEHLSPTTSEDPQSASPQSPSPSTTAPVEAPKVNEGAPKDVHDTLAMLNDMAKEEDSGIAFDSGSAVKAEGSDATRSDSYPVSPVGPSEKAESTKASSISESTEETVRGDSSAGDAVKVDDVKDEAEKTPAEEPNESATEIETAEKTPELPKEEVKEEAEVTPVKNIPAIETAVAEDISPKTVPVAEKEEEVVPATEIATKEEVPEKTLEQVIPAVEPAQEEEAAPEPQVIEEPAQVVEEPAANEKPVPAVEELVEEEPAAVAEPVHEPVEESVQEPVEEKPAPAVEEPVDELPRLLPVAYQPLLPVAYQPPTQVKQEKVQEPTPVTQEIPKVEPVLAPVESVEEPKYVPKIAAPASPAISAVGSKEPSHDVPESTILAQEPKTEVLGELKNHHDSPSSANAAGGKTLKTKKSLIIATEKAKALLPAQPSPLLPKSPEIKEWKIPKSKFSTPDLKAAAASPTSPTEPLPPRASRGSLSANPKSPAESNFSADTRGSMTSDDQRSRGSKRSKRAALIAPINTDLDVPTDRSRAGSEANFSSDDDLMDELQSAVLQEAKPISVSKSPMSPHFPTPERDNARSASNPMFNDGRQSQLLSPMMATPDSSRSISASAGYFGNMNQNANRPIVKKVNLGSGISQRIKALEQLSKANPGEAAPAATTAASSTFFSVRKGSVRSSKAPSIVDRANSLTRNNTPSPPTSQHSSPENMKLHSRSESVQSRVDALSANSSPVTQIQRQRPESVSVTARIVRDPGQPFPGRSDVGKNPSDFAPLDLKQSPLVIDHQRGSPSKESFDERLSSSSSKGSKSTMTVKEKRTSMSVVKDFIKEGRASFSEHRRSITLESSGSSTILSPSLPPSAHANKSPRLGRSPSIGSRKSGRGGASPTRSVASSSPTKDDGKPSNRASRLLRRMSSSMSSSRKTLARAISPTLREEEFEPASIDGLRDIPTTSPVVTSTNIGDVNVQFPDSLLWKRRFMMLDSQGFLILSPALSAKDQKLAGATRRMHMSEFRTPIIPDVEMQELPNSVVLDFVEGGSGLQIACEDRGGQGRILNILQDAHSTWAGHQ